MKCSFQGDKKRLHNQQRVKSELLKPDYISPLLDVSCDLFPVFCHFNVLRCWLWGFFKAGVHGADFTQQMICFAVGTLLFCVNVAASQQLLSLLIKNRRMSGICWNKACSPSAEERGSPLLLSAPSSGLRIKLDLMGRKSRIRRGWIIPTGSSLGAAAGEDALSVAGYCFYHRGGVRCIQQTFAPADGGLLPTHGFPQ